MNLPNRLTVMRIVLIPVIILIGIFPYAQVGIEVPALQFGFVSLSAVNVVMLARDTIVDGIRMIASSNGVVMAAGYLGKVKTVVQMLAVIFILLNNLPFELVRLPVSDFLLWFAAFTSLASGISYFNQMKDYIFESK